MSSKLTYLQPSILLILQDAFARNTKIVNPQSTGVLLCGQKQMAEVSVIISCHPYLNSSQSRN